MLALALCLYNVNLIWFDLNVVKRKMQKKYVYIVLMGIIFK